MSASHLIQYVCQWCTATLPIHSLGQFVLPEYAAQATLTLLFLVTGNVFCLAANAALTAYHVHR